MERLHDTIHRTTMTRRSQPVIYLAVSTRQRAASRKVSFWDRAILLAVFVFLVAGALLVIDRAATQQQVQVNLQAKTAQAAVTEF
jgi:hypothetical protein